eukprot:c19818_g1_i1 orf=121-1185(+)
MAVQAHDPSNNLLPDFSRRVQSTENKNMSRSVVVRGISAEESQFSPWVNVFKAPCTGFQPRPMVSNGAGATKKNVEEVPFKAYPLKRSWEAVYEQPPVMNRAVCGASAAVRLGTTPVFTGLRLATSTAMDSPFPQPSTSGFHLSDFAGNLQTHLDRQREDVYRLIDSQADVMKQAVEEKGKMHMQALLSLIEEGVSKRLKIKDAELERAKVRTMELEEGLKQLSLEAQLWKNLAKNNELMALNLKQNLEQVVLQLRDHQHNQHNHPYCHISREEGCGESEVDDAESCQHGGEGSFLRDCRDLKEQRKCRFCRVNDACVLVLPCRHLCLCLHCDGRLDQCPVCGITKNASLQVYT